MIARAIPRACPPFKGTARNAAETFVRASPLWPILFLSVSFIRFFAGKSSEPCSSISKKLPMEPQRLESRVLEARDYKKVRYVEAQYTPNDSEM